MTEVERALFAADEAATLALGRAIGAQLRRGQALALSGDLGAGKTTLARGVAVGLRVDEPDEVCSPTYLLVVEHPGPLPMVHIDAYLPAKTQAFLADGGVDYLADLGGVAVVEWAERVATLLPSETLWVELERAERRGIAGRRARLRGRSPTFSWLRPGAPLAIAGCEELSC